MPSFIWGSFAQREANTKARMSGFFLLLQSTVDKHSGREKNETNICARTQCETETRMPLLIFTFVLSSQRFKQPLCETVLRGSLARKGWLKIFLLFFSWFKDICLANNIIKLTMPPSRAKQRQTGFLPVVKYLDTLIAGFLSCRATYCMHIGIHLGYSCLVQNTG